MNFTCQRPYALYAILIIIPALIGTYLHYRNVARGLKEFTVKNDFSVSVKRMKNFRAALFFRSLFASLAWIMLVLAYAGFSWGTYLESVQTTGNALSLVFDISYSMNAEDAPSSLTRLEASKKYAQMLLSRVDNVSVSVVLAKGDGTVVVPVTEDKAAVETVIDSLSSGMMSAVGTSLGKGVRTAQKSFSASSARKNTIWLFTDGEETDGTLEASLSECIKSGISVCIIGFGSERETKVFAGDGKTSVYTALRADRMNQICKSVMKKTAGQKYLSSKVIFVDSTDVGSALQVLETISSQGFVANGKDFSSESDANITYEIKPVKRHSLFTGLCILFLVLLFVTTEIAPENITGRLKKQTAALLVICAVFSSCSAKKERAEGAKTVLESSWAWYQRKYNKAAAGYLSTLFLGEKTDDKLLQQYANYNLAVTYLSQNENESALLRFAATDENAPKAVRYASYYNLGIIAHKQGDYELSSEYFRNALKIDGTKHDAKVNLELSILKAEKEQLAKENAQVQVSQTEGKSSMEEAVFEKIREYDKKQWKNSEQSEKTSSSQDY